jgi:hypothetical protein
MDTMFSHSGSFRWKIWTGLQLKMWKQQQGDSTGEEPCWSRILGDGYGGGIWDRATQCLYSLPKSMEDLWTSDLR